MYQGPIRIEIPRETVGGVYPAKAYRSATAKPLVEVSHGTYTTALANAITALATTIEGDYSKNPLIVVPPNAPEII